LIDYRKLYQDYENDNIYSIQLEVGDSCYQGCIYCYMNAVENEKNTLSDKEINQILTDAKKLGVTAVEWLGGEPLIRKSIFKHMSTAKKCGFKNNIWTGGLPLADEFILKKTVKYADPGLISIHVSTVDPKVYSCLHPGRKKDDLKVILSSVENLLDSGYPNSNILNSVTFTGLQTAEDMIQTIDYFDNKYGIKTSLNVYHTYLRPGLLESDLERFIPKKNEVAKVYKHYSKHCGVTQLPMNCVNKQYCSATVAILCDGSVTPCATIREKNSPNIHRDGSFYDIFLKNRDYLVFKKLKNKNNLPKDCISCELSDKCWGCRSRAYASGNGIYGKDPRCFRKKEIEGIKKPC